MTDRRARRAQASAADRATQGSTPQAERRSSDVPARRRASLPGCGCGGWAVLLGLLFLVTRLVGACDDIAGPETVSPAASVPPAGATVDVDELEPGDCFAWYGATDEVEAVNAVECAVAHDAEVTGLVELPDPPGAAYDGAAVMAAAEVRCNAVYTEYTGEPALLSTGSASSYIYPGTEGWQQGDRSVVCLAEGEEPGTLTSSLRRTGSP